MALMFEQNLNDQACDCVVIGLHENLKLTPEAEQLNILSENKLRTMLEKSHFTGKVEETIWLPYLPGLSNQAVLVVGLGQAEQSSLVQQQKMIRATFKALYSQKYQHVLWCLSSVFGRTSIELEDHFRFVGRFSEEMAYRFNALKKTSANKITLERLSIPSEYADSVNIKQAFEQGSAIGQGINFARDLGNLPSNICTPSYLAQIAEGLAKNYSNLTTKIFDEAAIQAENMNAFLSVAKGSIEPPRFIEIHYQGGPANQAPYVFVGKGITFDSGGISLKPGAGMDEMKYDMCGAATVLGVLKAVAELKLPLNITGLIATCENMPSDRASKPGDIVKSRSGQTIEILNTDAEGRLILCDALDYAKKFNPAYVIDIATLTGAIIISLGHIPTGLFTHDDGLAAQLETAGYNSGDRVWRMPLWDDYNKMFESPFADMANIANDRGAGSIIAAAFLAKFTEGLRWAHLDIAGTAWISGQDKGATGRPIALLCEFLQKQI